ncbi:MAG: uroporphyrinogen-III C-methyltransferase [Actinomycetota bacterium]
MNARPGWVYLVGAGPGDPGLITRRGLELLRSCDVVLHDRLVAPELLDEARPTAERIFVGKAAGEPSLPQASIDALAVSHARAGRSVVRLKGGDPYVFGRGADEGQALAAAGIRFEIVPGVTSAIAAPAYAGIPVTHSGVSSSFAVVTAHESADRPASERRWRALAESADTIVLLMGVKALGESARKLIDAGRDPAEPAALVEWGTTSRQRVVAGELANIADLAEEAGIGPPATAIVGEVVRLRSALDWFSARPLFGKRIVVTRARHQARSLGDRLAQLGAHVLYLPVIEIADPPSWDEVDGAIKRLAEGLYSWIMLTSANAFEKLVERALDIGFDLKIFLHAKVAVVGRQTANLVEEHGLRVDKIPESFTGEGLARDFRRGQGRILLPRVAGAPGEIVEILRSAGWSVDEVVAYTNVVPAESPTADAIRTGEFDAVTFTSPSTVRNFVKLAGPPEDLGLSVADAPERLVACIGPKTAKAAEEAGMRVDATAAEPSAAGLAWALVGAAVEAQHQSS